MINTDGNPDFLNAFLDYTTLILNKSPGTVKEYNYDLTVRADVLTLDMYIEIANSL